MGDLRGCVSWVCGQGGVWVLGMMKGAAADRAGVRQGDEGLKIDGSDVTALSPFKAAGLLQGASLDAPPTVAITVRSSRSQQSDNVAVQALCRDRV